MRDLSRRRPRGAHLLLALTLSACLLAAGSGPAAAAPTGALKCTVEGTDRADLLRGTARYDVICGFGGDDVIIARGGDDYVFGGKGNDRIEGRGGSDRLNGERGDDITHGGPGIDFLYGESGDDRLFAGPGRDVLYGGLGRDVHRTGGGVREHVSGGPGQDLGAPEGGGYPSCPSTEKICQFSLHLDISAYCPSFTKFTGNCYGRTPYGNPGWAVYVQSLPGMFAQFGWVGSSDIVTNYRAVNAALPTAGLDGWVPNPSAPQYAIDDAVNFTWPNPGIHWYTPLGEYAGKVGGPLYINFVNGVIGADVYLDGYLFRR